MVYVTGMMSSTPHEARAAAAGETDGEVALKEERGGGARAFDLLFSRGGEPEEKTSSRDTDNVLWKRDLPTHAQSAVPWSLASSIEGRGARPFFQARSAGKSVLSDLT